MLSCSAVYQPFQDAGVRAFTGVPDSLLKDFCAYLSDHTPESPHTIAANEGRRAISAQGAPSSRRRAAERHTSSRTSRGPQNGLAATPPRILAR